MTVHDYSAEFDAVDRQVHEAVIPMVGPCDRPRACFYRFRFESEYLRGPALSARCARRSWWVALILLLAFTGVSAATKSPERLGVHDSPRPVPEITFENGDGEPMALADFRGKVVVLNLWATWCPPCRREMPTLDRLQAELGSERFEVAALSIDHAGPSIVREFFAEEGIEHLALYIDTSARALQRLSIRGIPTTLVLDAAGREVARLSGEADWATPAMLDYFRGLIAEQANGGGS